jgi:hypothetical protein
VLTENKLVEIEARLEHCPRKSLKTPCRGDLRLKVQVSNSLYFRKINFNA